MTPLDSQFGPVSDIVYYLYRQIDAPEFAVKMMNLEEAFFFISYALYHGRCHMDSMHCSLTVLEC